MTIFAFPNARSINDDSPTMGMELRDYFAIHCDQPGVAELVTAAGLTYSAGRIWLPADPKAALFPSFDAWWGSMMQSERLRLYAEVRYAMADAMMTARGTP